MSEEDISTTDPGGASPAGAIALTRASQAKADAYLEEQTRLAKLQSQNLVELNAFELSHLRWRRFNDQMKGALQIMLVAVGLLIVVGIGAAVWNAGRANGLLVDAFSAPPSFEQRGMGGDVVAGDITDRLAAVRKIGADHSFSTSSDVSKDRADEIKVEIPDTGVSISEAWRYLRRWLGHERHASGSLRQRGDGGIVLSVSLDDGRTITETGAVGELPVLEQKVAEAIFEAFDPVNYVNYLAAAGRHREAYEAAARYVQIAQGKLARADSYGLWSYTTAETTGDLDLATARAGVGIRIDPELAVLRIQEITFNDHLGRDEDTLHEAQAILPLRNEDQLPAHQGRGFAVMRSEARGMIAWLQGDFAGALPWYCDSGCPTGEEAAARAIGAARLHDVAGSKALLAEAFAAGTAAPDDENEARYYADAAAENWAAAISDASTARADLEAPQNDLSRRFLELVATTRYNPQIAIAEAHMGEFALASREIDKTDAGCVSCLVARGNIDGLKKNWGGAAYWFGRAIHDAPSVPFAYANWGAMLIARGDPESAIAKFKLANARGPHFVDPLEMWGEALIAKNRSDLALTKFQEADKYAPKWGRLHLEWGEALLWSGDKTGARKQFAIAATLDLSAPDKAQLAGMSHG